MSVEAVVLKLLPLSKHVANSSALSTFSSCKPYTDIEPFFSSLMLILLLLSPVASACCKLLASSKSFSSSLYISRKLHLMMNSVLPFRFSTSSKIKRMTLGMIPNSSSVSPLVYPDPIVHVLPEPVYPYANTVALQPKKQPKTRFLTHLSKTSSCRLSQLKQASKVNSFSPPIVTVLLSSKARTIYFSNSSFLMRGLTLSATLTEHAA